MANCPKCGKHLRIIDWKQHCPYCGANICLYNQQERLMQDADIAEVQYYHFQKKIDRVKSSFIGSKLAIVRIITSILPLAALFIPLINAKVLAPFEPVDGGVSFLTLYNNIDTLTGDAFSTLLAGNDKNAAIFMLASLGLLLLSVLALVLHFILLTLSCSPKGKPRNIALDVILLVTSIGSAVAATLIPDCSAISGVSLGIGAYLYIALMLVNAVIDYIVLFVKPVKIIHKQCYVGGIPIEEYFEMQEKGMTTEEIRQIQYARLRELQLEKEAKMAKEAEEAEQKEKEEKEAAASGRR